MAYKSRVTNKYMGSTFAGRVNSATKSDATDLVNILQKDVNPAINKIMVNEVANKKDTAVQELNQLLLTKDIKTVNKEILQGQHPNLTGKYIDRTVSYHTGKFEAIDAITNIEENRDKYNIEETNLPAFYKNYLPSFADKDGSYALGFASIFNEFKAKDAVRDASERSKLQKKTRFENISKVLDTKTGSEYHQQANSFIEPLPPEEGKKEMRYLNSPSEVNEIVLFNLDKGIDTASNTSELTRIEDIMRADRGVGQGGNQLGSIFSNKNNPKNAELIKKLNDKFRVLSNFEEREQNRKEKEEKDMFTSQYFAIDDSTLEGELEKDLLKKEALAKYSELAIVFNNVTKNMAETLEDSGAIRSLRDEIMNGKWTNRDDELRVEILKFTNSEDTYKSLMSDQLTAKKYEASGYQAPLQSPEYLSTVSDIEELLVTKLTGVQKKYESQKAFFISNLIKQDVGKQYLKWLKSNEKFDKLDAPDVKNAWFEKETEFLNKVYNDTIKKYDNALWLKASADLINSGNVLTTTGADLAIEFEESVVSNAAKNVTKEQITSIEQEAERTLTNPVDAYMESETFESIINKPEWADVKADGVKRRALATKILTEAGVNIQDFAEERQQLIDSISSNIQNFTMPQIETYTPLGVFKKGDSVLKQQNYFIDALEQITGVPFNMELYNRVLTEDAKIALAGAFNIDTLQLDELVKQYLK
jgi:hypothetical protein